MDSDHNSRSEPSQSTEDSNIALKKSLEYAEELKNEGNDHFRGKRWEDALAAYRSGVGNLPKRKHPPQSSSREDDLEPAGNKDDAGPSSQDAERASDEAKEDTETQEDPEDPELVKIRAVLNANIAACYVKLNEHKAAVEACTEALLDDPHYIKALQRRAASNDKLDTWTSLTSVQEDYNTLLKIVPASSNESTEIQRALRNLKPRIEAAQKKETGEMLDKLKGLGNSILGNFGLSTDNFKFVPNGQGGYSVNFSK